MNTARPPSLKSFLLTRILLVTGLFAVALIGSAELYLRHMFDRQQAMNFRTALESSAKSIHSDLEFGDLWSVRRNLSQIVDGKAIRAIELRNATSGELILSVPDSYTPEPAAPMVRPRHDAGRYDVTWKSPQTDLVWTLTGFPGRLEAPLAEARTRLIYFSAILVLVLSFAFATWFLANRLVSDIDTIDRTLAKISPDTVIAEPDPDLATLEARRAYMRILETSQILVESIKRQRELAVQGAVGKIAQQVAHDIRSPLAALDAALKDLASLPEETRVLVRGAAGRIRDIANDLIEKSRAPSADDAESLDITASSSGGAENEPLGRSPQLLSSLLDAIVTEKRLQFRSRLGVEIDLRQEPSSYGLFAELHPSEFKRVISNLVNNAVEAIKGRGLVTVELAGGDDCIEIRVRDDGKGIPEAMLARLGQRGQTHDKPGGSGLGLHHAKMNVSAWGGRLEIASETGKGTTVTARLPRARSPGWFVSSVVVLPGAAVVIFDDDTSIHQIWQGRFESAGTKERGVEIVHISTPDELRAWTRTTGPKSTAALYLMDYELLGYSETGLSLAEELGIGTRSILVTSRFEEKGVLADAQRLKVRLIPKPLAGFVPIQVAQEPPRERLDAALIDDDPLARMNWKMAAERAGKRFKSYSTVAEFLQAAPAIARETPVYVDAALGDGVNGAEESLCVYQLGFDEIYLATGYESAKFASFKHLRGVVGKDPPWGAAATATTPRPSSPQAA